MIRRTQNFRERAKEARGDMNQQYEDAYKTKDDRGYITGSFFDLDILKELEIDIWRPDIGEHIVDVIQFYAGKQHPTIPEGKRTYKVDFYGHRNIGAMNDFFICNALTWKIPDSICTYMKQNFIEDKKLYNAIKPSRRCAYLVWVQDNDEERAKGLQLFEVAHWFFEAKIAGVARKPRGGGYTDWTSIDSGMSVYWNIQVTGTYEGADGKSRDSIGFDSFQLVPRDNPRIPDEILAQTFPLDEALKMHPNDEDVKLAFFGSSTPTKEEKTSVETPSRLPKQTALERARAQAEKKKQKGERIAPEPDQGEQVIGLQCEVCGADVYETRSGRVCEDGHGGIEGISKEAPLEEPPSKLTASVVSGSEESSTIDGGSPPGGTTDYVCPASEVGGQFGVTIEQMDECDDCEIWEQCSDANDALKKGKTTEESAKSEEEPEGNGKPKLVKRS